jgi:hypothetical protein
MDDALFLQGKAKMSKLSKNKYGDCLFGHICGTLEKVSIRNACYGHPLLERKSIPESVLVKFVRRAPKLVLFLSDLSPDNVNILKRERPKVKFEEEPTPDDEESTASDDNST